MKAPETNHKKGIIYALLSMFAFCVVNSCGKVQTDRYSFAEIVFFRNFFAILPCLLMLAGQGGLSAMKTKRLPLHVVNGVVGAVGIICLFGSFHHLPLAEATAIQFANILFVTVFSMIFLKESVGLYRWAAVAIGFGGVLIMSQPKGDLLNIGALYAIAFAVMEGYVMLNARILTRTDSSAAVVLYYAIFASLTSAILMSFSWVTPTLNDTLILIFIGVGGGIGQLLLTQAYRFASPSVVAPMIYTALIWNGLFGYLFWGDSLTLQLAQGACFIVGGGLIIIFREAYLGKRFKKQYSKESL